MRLRSAASLPTILLVLLSLALPGSAEDAPKLAWTTTGINEARKAGKPIALCVCDPAIFALRADDGKGGAYLVRGESELGRKIEAILDNGGLRLALADFTLVRLSTFNSSWPPHFLQAARNGFVLYVMTCDAVPVALFTPQNIGQPVKDAQGKESYPAVLAAASQAQKRNSGALEAMKKSPPKPYVSPAEIAAKRLEAMNAADQPKDEKKGLRGLLGDESKKTDDHVSAAPATTKSETGRTPIRSEEEE